MGGLAACAGGAGIGALACLALRGLPALGAFFAKARKARSARSVAARSAASATRQFTDAAADSLRVAGGRGAASGSVSERRKAFVDLFDEQLLNELELVIRTAQIDVDDDMAKQQAGIQLTVNEAILKFLIPLKNAITAVERQALPKAPDPPSLPAPTSDGRDVDEQAESLLAALGVGLRYRHWRHLLCI